MKLYLIRHGQTTANLAKTYAGQSDVPLTEQGKQQARDIAPILADVKFDKVYSSDLSRAIDTQKLALPSYMAVTTPLLRECDVGELVGEGFGAAVERYGERFSKTRDYSLFGGENFEMVTARLVEFLESVEQENYENIAVFSHNGMMSTMLRHVIGTEFDRTSVRTNNCGIHVFEHDGKKWRLLAWNYMGRV